MSNNSYLIEYIYIYKIKYIYIYIHTYIFFAPEESKVAEKIRSKRTAEGAQFCYCRLISSGYSPDRVESSG